MEEQSVHAAFCRLYYKLKHHGNLIFSQMLSNLHKGRYSRMLWSEDIISLNKKISDILSQVQFLTQLQQAAVLILILLSHPITSSTNSSAG